MGKIKTSKKEIKIPHGIHEGISNWSYHHDYKEYVTAHGINDLIVSPKYFKAKLSSDEQTPAMAVGSASHSIIIENDADAVLIAPCKTRYGKTWDDFSEQAPKDKTIVLKKEYDNILIMKQEIQKKNMAMSIINHKNALREISVFCEHDMFEGVLCKSRPDIAFEDEMFNAIVDYKTISGTATYTEFQKQIVNYGYDIQSAWYIHIMKIVTGLDWRFLWMVQEKEPPWDVKYYLCSDEFIERGNKTINQALTIYWESQNTKGGFDKGYEEKLETIYPPAWATK